MSETYAVGDKFGLDSNYSNKAEWCNENGYMIVEIDRDEEGNRQFQIQEAPQPTELDNLYNEIGEIKQSLAKYKEDVEQVELFGMERDDYEEKKETCANYILKLRELEAKVAELGGEL